MNGKDLLDGLVDVVFDWRAVEHDVDWEGTSWDDGFRQRAARQRKFLVGFFQQRHRVVAPACLFLQEIKQPLQIDLVIGELVEIKAKSKLKLR